eukprot:ANDGO_07650.mRNA.1 ELMO domain-containing protein C
MSFSAYITNVEIVPSPKPFARYVVSIVYFAQSIVSQDDPSVVRWTVRRRFSEFQQLLSELKKQRPQIMPVLPGLPSKLSHKSPLDSSVLLNRKERFNELLAVLSRFDKWIDVPCICTFLGFDVYLDDRNVHSGFPNELLSERDADGINAKRCLSNGEIYGKIEVARPHAKGSGSSSGSGSSNAPSSALFGHRIRIGWPGWHRSASSSYGSGTFSSLTDVQLERAICDASSGESFQNEAEIEPQHSCLDPSSDDAPATASGSGSPTNSAYRAAPSFSASVAFGTQPATGPSAIAPILRYTSSHAYVPQVSLFDSIQIPFAITLPVQNGFSQFRSLISSANFGSESDIHSKAVLPEKFYIAVEHISSIELVISNSSGTGSGSGSSSFSSSSSSSASGSGTVGLPAVPAEQGNDSSNATPPQSESSPSKNGETFDAGSGSAESPTATEPECDPMPLLILHLSNSTSLSIRSPRSVDLAEVFSAEYVRYKCLRSTLSSHFASIQIAPFDPSSVAHMDKLYELFSLLMPDHPAPAPKDPMWSRIGFQGKDPSTDFRAMGTWGLEQLVYFARNYTAEARAIVADDPEYPVACSGINISHLLWQRLVAAVKPTVAAAGSSASDGDDLFSFMACLCMGGEVTAEQMVHELYSALVLYLDYQFQKTSAGYMQFGGVLQRVCEKLLRNVVKKYLAWDGSVPTVVPIRSIDAFRVELFSYQGEEQVSHSEHK